LSEEEKDSTKPFCMVDVSIEDIISTAVPTMMAERQVVIVKEAQDLVVPSTS
jgi:hypothetical protein